MLAKGIITEEQVEASLARNRNLGLISMRERAELERGTLEIKSKPGKGTEVRVELRLESGPDNA